MYHNSKFGAAVKQLFLKACHWVFANDDAGECLEPVSLLSRENGQTFSPPTSTIYGPLTVTV
jgi:hypothetical protein